MASWQNVRSHDASHPLVLACESVAPASTSRWTQDVLFRNPDECADDDDLRSRCVRRLLNDPPPACGPSGSCEIPRVIVQFWNDSSAIPADVSECVDSWRSAARASGFTHILFDDT